MHARRQQQQQQQRTTTPTDAEGLSLSVRATTGRGSKRRYSPTGTRSAGTGSSSASRGHVAAHSAAANDASPDGGGGSFQIIVAARVRPFNKKELKRWQKERQKQLGAMLPQLAAAAVAGPTTANPAAAVANTHAVRAALHKKRHNERQPFGPGGPSAAAAASSPPLAELAWNNHNEIDPELLATLSETNPEMAAALRHAQVRFLGHSDGLSSSSPESEVLGSSPMPVVDVEPDGHTLTLLDPASPSTARGAFTFDYIFSSFAPTVELLLPGSGGGGRQRERGGGGASPLSFRSRGGSSSISGADEHAVNMSTAILSEDTVLSPQQEELAEQEQQRIFALLGAPLLESALQGFNACIFAYGQTSSGKTYTMLGTKRHWGITPRLLHSLFHRLSTGDGNAAAREGEEEEERGGSRMGSGSRAGFDHENDEQHGDQPDFTSGSPVSLPTVARGPAWKSRNGARSSNNNNNNHNDNSARVVGDGLSLESPAASPSRRSSTSSRIHVPSRRGPSSSSGGVVHVDVAYMEIYNEQVRDLLKQRSKNAILHYSSRFDAKDVDYNEYQTLRVRQHPKHGLFVEGLTSVRVNSWAECERHLKQGSLLRTQAATSMNATSSRSHAIFQVTITRVENLGGRVRGKAVTSQRVSKINLVDLAGSERNSASATSTKGKKSHLQEANSINVSLSTLRRVIDALVTNSTGANKTPAVVVPYRESLLTYVLSDNFGGNSKTVMCANISPSGDNLSETESTLRYATLARGVRNRVRVNEDPSARVIHELQNRIQGLQEELAVAPSPRHVAELELDLEENAAALADLREKHDGLAQALREQQAHEAQLRQELAERHEQEERWRREAEREREERTRLEKMVRRLHDENSALSQSAGTARDEASPPSNTPFLRAAIGDDESENNESDAGGAAAGTGAKQKTKPATSPSARVKKRRASSKPQVMPSGRRRSSLGGAPLFSPQAARKRRSSIGAAVAAKGGPYHVGKSDGQQLPSPSLQRRKTKEKRVAGEAEGSAGQSLAAPTTGAGGSGSGRGRGGGGDGHRRGRRRSGAEGAAAAVLPSLSPPRQRRRSSVGNVSPVSPSIATGSSSRTPTTAAAAAGHVPRPPPKESSPLALMKARMKQQSGATTTAAGNGGAVLSSLRLRASPQAATEGVPVPHTSESLSPSRVHKEDSDDNEDNREEGQEEPEQQAVVAATLGAVMADAIRESSPHKSPSRHRGDASSSGEDHHNSSSSDLVDASSRPTLVKEMVAAVLPLPVARTRSESEEDSGGTGSARRHPSASAAEPSLPFTRTADVNMFNTEAYLNRSSLDVSV